MRTLERPARRYLRQVRSWLPCGGKMKKDILEAIRGSLAAWQGENPGGTYQQITARFGSPGQIAAAYIGEADTGELLGNLRIKGRILRAVCAALAIIVLLWAAVVGISLLNELNSADGYYGPETIVEETV